MIKEKVDPKVVRETLEHYNVDKEQLIEFLYDLGELYDLEDLIELAEVLDE